MRVNTQNDTEQYDNILSTIDPNSDLGIYIGSLLSRIQHLSNLHDGAVSIFHRMVSAVQVLDSENDQLNADNSRLRRENDELREEIARLRKGEGSF